MNRILAQVLDWYVYTRFVAIRSREGKHFRACRIGRGRVAANFHCRCGATRQFDHSNAAAGHTSLFALSVVNRAVTTNATLRPAADSSLSPDSIGEAIVEKIALLGRG